MVALGAQGTNVIETVKVSNGTSTVGPAFSGTFKTWFVDGQRFLTNTGNTVWTYSAAATQQSIVALPSVATLYGVGNWIVNYGRNPSNVDVTIYAAGASSPSATYTLLAGTVIPSANTLGIISGLQGIFSIVDLSGSTPVKTDTSYPSPSTYTAYSATKWFVGNDSGVITDSASHSLSYGQARTIVAGTTKVAIATANGLITVLNPLTPTVTGTITFPSSSLALSSDDTVLAAADDQGTSDRTLNLYSLPSATITQSFPSTYNTKPFLLDFSLSVLGNMLEQTLSTVSGTARTVTPTAGGAPVWSDNLSGDVRLSPDGP